MLIDSHAHVLSEFFENIDEVIENAMKNNIKKIINCATDISTSYEVINISKKYKNVFPAVGIHPESAKDNIDKIEELEKIINKEKVIAIGERGLDYYYGKENKDIQIKLFEEQLKIAEKYNLPVIIHSREATQDTISILKKYKVKGIIHCFSGSTETAKEYIKMGYLLGVNGIVTFKNSKNIKEVLKNIGLSSIVLETDCPFLTPEPFRKYKNEPKYVLTVAKFLSMFFDKDLQEIEKITTNNVLSIFDI